MEGTEFTFNGANEAKNYLTYPGGLAVFGSKAEFKKSGETDSNDYNLTFDLEIDYNNQTSTDLLWALYMVEEQDGQNPLENKLDPACKLNVLPGQGEEKNETHYWYSDNNENSESEKGKSCTLSSNQVSTLATTHMIAYGKLEAGQNKTINSQTSAIAGAAELAPETSDGVTSELYNAEKKTTENPLVGRTLNTNNNKVKYYYLVVQYPNKDEKQNDDSEQKDISVTLKVAADSAKATLLEG